jgi:hypothetical protein
MIFHMFRLGVADIPKCVTVNETICEMVEELLAFGAYNSFVQSTVIQAQYFKVLIHIAYIDIDILIGSDEI